MIDESDSQVLISRLSRVALYYSDFDVTFGDIISLCSDFHAISFYHAKRLGILYLTTL